MLLADTTTSVCFTMDFACSLQECIRQGPIHELRPDNELELVDMTPLMEKIRNLTTKPQSVKQQNKQPHALFCMKFEWVVKRRGGGGL
jgi:hypothetical protein